MKKRIKDNPNYKKILIILSIILGVLLLSYLLYRLFIPHFHDQAFLAKVNINYQSEYENNPGYICYGNAFSCNGVETSTEGDVDTNTLGDYKVKYTFSYEGKTLHKEQEVIVDDETSPTLTVDGTEFFYCPNGNPYSYPITANDNIDGDISSKITAKVKDNHIIYSVTDEAGNVTTEIKDATEKDDEGPKITLNGDASIYLIKGSTYNEQGASAVDNCDGDVSTSIAISGSVDTSKIGEYTITYTVSDKKGNQSTLTRTIYVYSMNDTTTPSGSSIYLTFDDGPGPYTEQLLDVLKKYNVKATFFVTDQKGSKGYDSMIKREYDEGHTVGLHTATHYYAYIYSGVDNYFEDLNAISWKVKNITGYTSTIIRFPGGSSNMVSKNYDGGTHIMSTLTQAVEAKGYHYFDWNVTSGDAGNTTSTSVVISNVEKALGNGSTYVVLQHDIKKFSVDAVETIIQYGLSHGYTFRPITMSTPTVHHHIAN